MTQTQFRTLDLPGNVDVNRTIGNELRRRDQGFMRVVSADKGKGTYETATGNGKTTTKPFTFEVVNGIVAILTPPPPEAVNADHTDFSGKGMPRAAEDGDYAPPSPWTQALAKGKAASTDPSAKIRAASDAATSLEDQYKTRRAAEFAAERISCDEAIRNAELYAVAEVGAESVKPYAPPSPWSIAVEKGKH
jgi:hypothetical protein